MDPGLDLNVIVGLTSKYVFINEFVIYHFCHHHHSTFIKYLSMKCANDEIIFLDDFCLVLILTERSR